MTADTAVRGLWCAMLTPLATSGGVDRRRFVEHARWLLERGVDGVSPFGTTGEGPSFSLHERREGLDALLQGGIPGDRVVAATGCASLAETIDLTVHAVAAGCRGCLVLPPFFWKEVSDDGLFEWYARVIEHAGDRLRLYLYHLPQVSATPLSVELVERLARAFPGVIVGVKDSGGDWFHTQALLERVPQLAVLVGHEPHLPRLMENGGAGTICGVANIFPGLVQRLLSADVTLDDESRINAFLEIAFRQPFLAAFKTMVAARSGHRGWRALRLPLVALDDAAGERVVRSLRDAGLPLDRAA